MYDERENPRLARRLGRWMALAPLSIVISTSLNQPCYAQNHLDAVRSSGSFAPLVENVAAAVVSIEVIANAPISLSANDLPIDGALISRTSATQRDPGKSTILGSGFIIDPAGLIVTSDHVVANATKITVILANGRRYETTGVFHDAATDLAVLKIEAATSLPVVHWGDSDKLHIGDELLSMGNPYGVGQTATAGILSASARAIEGESDYIDFLQIDAPTNPGGSGGPVFNRDGGVIGITTAILSPTGANIGLGFAIPSSIAKSVIDQLQASGHVTRGYLGMGGQQVTRAIAVALGLPANTAGVIVSNVDAGQPGATAGVETGDIIQKINDHAVQDITTLPRLIASLPIGTPVSLTIMRQGRIRVLHATIGMAPEPEATALDETGGDVLSEKRDALGLELAPLDVLAAHHLDLPDNTMGALVTSVAPASAAEQAGIKSGDVIERIDSQITRNPFEASEQIVYAARTNPGKPVLMFVNRRGREQFVSVQTHPASQDNDYTRSARASYRLQSNSKI